MSNTKAYAFCYSPLTIEHSLPITRFLSLLLTLPLSLSLMALSKINRRVKSNPDTGFGTQAGSIGERFINRDGSFNLRKTGWPFWKRMSLYSFLLDLSWTKFLMVIVAFYFLANLFFTSFYVLVGLQQLQGFVETSEWGKIKEAFYFSTQSFTTVGYGRINPAGDGANIVASIETMCGWLFFALVTGILYGRFTRPKAYIAFSENLLVSPYKESRALMFRMVPYKDSHQLTDTRIAVNLSLLVTDNGKTDYEFYQLALERSRIDMFNMNWTVVHPINENSPLYNFMEQDFTDADFELMVQVTGFDPVYSSQVMQMTSYTMDELVWGARFSLMYHQSKEGATTVLELDKLNHYEEVSLPLNDLQKITDAVRTAGF